MPSNARIGNSTHENETETDHNKRTRRVYIHFERVGHFLPLDNDGKPAGEFFIRDVRFPCRCFVNEPSSIKFRVIAVPVAGRSYPITS